MSKEFLKCLFFFECPLHKHPIYAVRASCHVLVKISLGGNLCIVRLQESVDRKRKAPGKAHSACAMGAGLTVRLLAPLSRLIGCHQVAQRKQSDYSAGRGFRGAANANRIVSTPWRVAYRGIPTSGLCLAQNCSNIQNYSLYPRAALPTSYSLPHGAWNVIYQLICDRRWIDVRVVGSPWLWHV